MGPSRPFDPSDPSEWSDQDRQARLAQLESAAEGLDEAFGYRVGWINILSIGGDGIVVELAAPRVVLTGATGWDRAVDALERDIRQIVHDAMPDAVVSVFLSAMQP